MESGKLLMSLFGPKIVSVLRLFLRDKDKEYYLREVSKLTKVPAATTFRILHKLLELGIINEIRVKKFKLYKLADNENVMFLESFLKEETQILNEFVKMVSRMNGVESIMLHEKELKDRANLLIIGDGVNTGQIKTWCGEVREKHKFTISSLTLTREQFEQMSGMGLYSGEKTVLFRRQEKN